MLSLDLASLVAGSGIRGQFESKFKALLKDIEDASDDELLDDADLSHYFSAEEDTPDGQDPRARVLSVLELEDLFLRTAPDLSGEMNTPLVLQPIFNVPSLQSSRTHLETIQPNSSLAWLVTLTLENPAPSTP